MYVICAPLWYQPTSPPEQKDCRIEKCPKCSTQMWVSEKKRKLRAKNKIYKVWCGECVVIDVHSKGGDPKEVELIDLLELH